MRTPGDRPDPPTRQVSRELVLPFVNLRSLSGPSRSQAGSTDTWKLSAYFQSTLMPLALGTLASGCRHRSGGAEERMSLQEQGQGPGHGRNVRLGSQGSAEKAAFAWAL